MPRKPLPSIEIAGKDHACAHAGIWPPLEIIAYEVKEAQELRYVVSDVVYQRLRTWEQVCGLREMDEAKCPQCPHVVVNGVRAKEPGTGVKRNIDTPSLMHDRQSRSKK